jgi:hypothetical protein
MTKTFVGLFASATLLSSGLALANGGDKHSQQTQMGSQPSAQLVQMKSQPMGDMEITGTVIKSSGDELKLRTDSGIIAVKINKDTKFQDATLKRARDLKEGQLVRASFIVDKDLNLAKSVSLDTGMGGSGLNSDTGLNQDMGGSGSDMGLDRDMGSGDVTGAHGHDSAQPGGKTF